MIAFAELLYSAQEIYAANFQTIPLLIVASIWYLVMTSVLYVGQYFIERRYGRGFSRRSRRRCGSAGWRSGSGAAHERRDGQSRGRPQALRAPRGAEGNRSRGQPRRGDVHARSLRLGQVHVPALHQPPGEDQRRPAVGRRRAGRLSRVDGKLYELHEREVARKRAEIGMVFQHFNLFPHMTALENVALAPIQVKGVPRSERPEPGQRAASAGRARRQARHVPRRAVRRPAAACGDRPRARDAAQADAVRRADLGARPRAGRRRARRDARSWPATA